MQERGKEVPRILRPDLVQSAKLQNRPKGPGIETGKPAQIDQSLGIRREKIRELEPEDQKTRNSYFIIAVCIFYK